MNSLLRTLFIVVAASLSLSSCALVLCLIDTDVSRTPRFKNVAGHELLTRKKLYL
ncbi:MAG: hypothetical protein JWR15_3849, partial [Prosthecobacter sp.]|nr:hypothetical protein [Prosthecobacter sp.]